MALNYEHIETQGGGYISALDGASQEIGKLTYSLDPDNNRMIITYVMVLPIHEGKGYGKKLVEKGIEFARDKNYKILPHCSFARTVLLRMNDVEDVYP